MAAGGRRALTLGDPGGTLAAGDAARGEVILKKCYACHSVVPDETGLTGPNLFGVVGRAVASAQEFEYSDALEALPMRGYRRWTEAALDASITSPGDVAPGTTLTLVGMPDREERAGPIAYRARTGAGSGGE